MSRNICKKLSGWLAALVLAPVVGWGQSIPLLFPENITVCEGSSAAFNASTVGERAIEWRINDQTLDNLSPEIAKYIMIEEVESSFSVGFVRQELLTVTYNETLDGLQLSTAIPGTNQTTPTAYLTYENKQQHSITNLTTVIDKTNVQFHWNKLDSNFQYFVSVCDSHNNLIASQTTNTTHFSFDLQPRANNSNCQYLQFRIIACKCLESDCGFIQTNATIFVYREPDIDISPVTAEFDNNQTVLVSWTPDGGNAFRIVITDLDSGNNIQVTTEDDPPFSYIPENCGKLTNLNVSVSPDQCADDQAFTHSDTISFTINCSITETETETEPTTQPSGALANYPSLLLTVATVIPLLKWQH